MKAARERDIVAAPNEHYLHVFFCWMASEVLNWMKNVSSAVCRELVIEKTNDG